MKLLDRAKRAALAAYDALDRDAPETDAHEALTRVTLECADLQDKLADHERCLRQNKMYYELVDNFQTQRDQWKEMFLTQSAENAAAQSYMQAELEKAGHLVSAVVSLLNTERAAAKKPLFELDHRLDTGGAVKKRFDELLAELKAHAPPDVDFMKKRDEIATGGDIVVQSGDAADKPGGLYFDAQRRLSFVHMYLMSKSIGVTHTDAVLEASFEKAVEAWHKTATSMSIHEWLGLTEGEYGAWVDKTQTLREILDKKTSRAPFAASVGGAGR